MSNIYDGRRVGRNDRCPCGSGVKFKRCHGAVKTLPFDRDFEASLSRAQAGQYQRIKQQGLGRPIISFQSHGRRCVAVSDKMVWGGWLTFIDFLGDYIKNYLSSEWGNAELRKPFIDRHPILQWYDFVCRQQKTPANVPGVRSTPTTGAMAAYYWLAYDLYTIDHNAHNDRARLPEDVLRRLKSASEFSSARHEILVAAIFLRGGYTIQWEDERDRSMSHCEFEATSIASGKVFSVECKMPQPSKVDPDRPPSFNQLLVSALKKNARHDRIVFIELNTPKQASGSLVTDWMAAAVRQTRLLDMDPNHKDLPPAYVVITSYPWHHHLESVVTFGGIAEGFRISDFKYDAMATLEEHIVARDKHAEVNSLLRSMKTHSRIPSTFDGSIPDFGETSAVQFQVGCRYEMTDGAIGLLSDATVLPAEKRIYGVFEFEDGRSVVFEHVMSEDEWDAYSSHPDTFFGILKSPGGPIASPIELFDFFFETYRHSERGDLLRWLQKSVPECDLSAASKDDLARIYSLKLANAQLRVEDWTNPHGTQRKGRTAPAQK